MALLTDINALAQTPSSVLNFITGSDSSAGWAGTSATVTTNTTTSFIPAYPIRTTSIKIDVTGSGGYGATSFTVPGGVGELVGVSFYYITNDTTASNWTIELWNGATQITLPSPSLVGTTTGLPYGFSVTLTKGATYNIRFKSAASGKQIYLSGVTCGTSIPTQGAAISDWISFTPTGSWTTNTTYTGRYMRDGANMRIKYGIALTGAPGGTSQLGVNLPSGYTLNTTALLSQPRVENIATLTSYNAAGIGYTAPGYCEYDPSVSQTLTGRFFLIGAATANTAVVVNATAPYTWASGDYIEIEAYVPIAQWAGNGVVNLGAGAQVEYAWNSSTSATTDTTSFGYGPSGVLFQAFAPSGTSAITKRVQFQYPIQIDDAIVVQVDNGQGIWTDLTDRLGGYTRNDAGTIGYGNIVVIQSNTQVDINFYSSLADKVTAWGALNAWKWRVRKAKASSPVGFGLATQTASGLINNQVPPTNLTAADLTSQTSCTIDAGDVAIFKWSLVNNMVTMVYILNTITITASATSFSFTLPTSVPRPLSNTTFLGIAYDNTAATQSSMEVTITTSGVVQHQKFGASWTGGVNTSYIRMQMSWFIV